MSNNLEARVTVWKLSLQQAAGIAGTPAMPDDSAAAVSQLASDLRPQRVEIEADSLDAASRQLPAGAYTTFRTFQRVQVLHLSDHFLRLENTAYLASHPMTINRGAIRSALRWIMASYPAGEMRIRVSIDLEQAAGTTYLMVEPLHVPSEEDYHHGVRVVTYRLQRQNPKAKLTSFIETAARVRQELPQGINEAVMVGDDGCLLEGLSSNFFAVLNGEVWTAEQGVLSGITRSMVIEGACQAGVQLRMEGLPAAMLPKISEAFITSASRAVLPVTTIDGQPVGPGNPGPVTQILAAGYQALIEQALEAL